MLIEFLFDITRAVLRLFLSPLWWLGLWGPRPPGCGHGFWGGPRPPYPLHGPDQWGYGGHHHHGHHHHGHHHHH